jgi:hypothetical protein
MVMKSVRLGSVLLLLLAPAVAGQEIVNRPAGIFICDSEHPRCAVSDQATYRYHQFGMQPGIGQFSGVSDVLGPGAPLDHYQTFLAELISRRADTNAVALWADTMSRVDRGRVWGAFASARSELPPGQDSQLIGLEIDVLNGGLPGRYPHASKVGLQVVGFGAENTNAIEVLTEGSTSGQFVNVFNVQPGTTTPDGTIFGIAPQRAALGLNLEGSTFSDSAILLSDLARISFRDGARGGDAAIYRDAFDRGHLVLQAGPAGLRVTDSGNTANLFRLSADGRSQFDVIVAKRYLVGLAGTSLDVGALLLALTSACALLLAFCLHLLVRLRRLEGIGVGARAT